MSSCVCRIPAIRIRCRRYRPLFAEVDPERGSQISDLGSRRWTMSVLEAVAIAAAGFGAGVINTVVGSGTLLTFPVLLGFGYAPVTANVSNTIGLVPGGLSRDARLPRRARGPAGGAPSCSALASIAGALARRDAPAHAARVGVRGDRAVPDRRRARARGRAAVARRRGSRRAAAATRLPRRRRGRRPPCSRSASTAATSARRRGSCCSPCSASSLTETLQRDQRAEERARDGDEPRRRRWSSRSPGRSTGASPA